MIDRIFDWCVQVLLSGAALLGITYEEINVWVFVFIWPFITVLLLLIIAIQHRQIQRLKEKTK